MRLTRVVWAGLLVASGASAGGLDPVARTELLGWVPGAVHFSAPEPTELEQFTGKVSLRVRGQTVTVYVVTSLRLEEGQAGTDRLNNVMAWVATSTPSAVEKEALVRVVLTHLRVCSGLPVAYAPQIQALAARVWGTPQGLQRLALPPFKVEWSDGSGLNIAGKDRAGISAEWPLSQSRCTF